MQGNYSGYLSNLGELLTIRDDRGSEVVSTFTPVDPSDLQRFLVISEIMYHPANQPDAEFIELMNISESVTLDLSGVSFTEGIIYHFPQGTSLPARQRVVVSFADFISSRLSNGGETLKLEGADGETIREFAYDDQDGWPNAADGHGASLVLINPEKNPDPSLPQSWRPSAQPGGSPGQDDRIFFTGNAHDDLDRDGTNTLLEHALGTSDQIPNRPPIFFERLPSESNLTIMRNLAADDVSIMIESSQDLSHWNALTDLTATPGPYLETGSQAQTYLLPEVFGDKTFYRLRVFLR